MLRIKKLENLPIRKRLLFTNFIMFIIPSVFIILVSTAIFLILQFGNINRSAIISFIWPESTRVLAIQFELSRLRVQSDQYNGNMRQLQKISDHLKSQGLNVAIYQNEQLLYCTAGEDDTAVAASVKAYNMEGNEALVWSDQGLAFSYSSPVTGIKAFVSGETQLYQGNSIFNLTSKDFLKKAFGVMIAATILLAICVGIYLSKWLARQIIRPLEELNRIADQIGQGNLDEPVINDMNDEIGRLCRSFEKMRIEIKAGKVMRDKYDHNRKELIAGISHDLSTPLTKIEGYACGLIDGIADTQEKRNHYLAMILETSKNMAHLVQTLFLFSKFDLKQVDFQWEAVELCSYFTDYIGEQEDHLRHQGLAVSFCPQTDHAVVLMDRLHFQRVIENIIGNSIKYKTESCGELVIVLSLLNDETVELTFTDNGKGVKDEELPYLFDAFYRTDKARTEVARGSGLGLAVVRQIVEEMKGTIHAFSAVPKGLTICIELPIWKGDADHEKNFDYRG